SLHSDFPARSARRVVVLPQARAVLQGAALQRVKVARLKLPRSRTRVALTSRRPAVRAARASKRPLPSKTRAPISPRRAVRAARASNRRRPIRTRKRRNSPLGFSEHTGAPPRRGFFLSTQPRRG